MIKFKAKIIKVVSNSGSHKKMLISSNIISNSQIMAMLIAKLKIPKLIILKGRVIAFTMGFTKKFISPKTIPKTKKTCHWLLKDMPKKFDSGYNFTATPGTNNTASQSPAVAATT